MSDYAQRAAEKLEAESYEWLELTIHGDAYAEQAFDIEKMAAIIREEPAKDQTALVEAARMVVDHYKDQGMFRNLDDYKRIDALRAALGDCKPKVCVCGRAMEMASSQLPVVSLSKLRGPSHEKPPEDESGGGMV